jgi:multidrug efflux system membrane fusion protein
MYARMGVTIESRKNATLVPKAAVVDYDSKRGVFTVTAENKARFMPIEAGIEDAQRVEVRAGLTPQDTLVVNGASALRNDDVLIVAGQESKGRGPAGRSDAAPAGGAPAAENGARKRPDARP